MGGGKGVGGWGVTPGAHRGVPDTSLYHNRRQRPNPRIQGSSPNPNPKGGGGQPPTATRNHHSHAEGERPAGGCKGDNPAYRQLEVPTHTARREGEEKPNPPMNSDEVIPGGNRGQPGPTGGAGCKIRPSGA